MLKPPTPANETQRLQVLRSLKLLDTPPEERFDRVTRLARQVFGVPIALVTLVDADRQWFKSNQGLDAAETPRNVSFCGHVILDDRIMVVNDATNDERFCDNPLVCDDPNIRFYAGYPISASDGSRVGTLCVIDREPRQVSKEQLQLLRELGRMVEEELMATNDLTIDPVTGLSSRNGFLAIAEHLLAMCVRTEQPATLLTFELENFDTINADGGRKLCDAAATELAHELLACFRNSDIVARLAPDVFCVLLAGSNLDGVDTARNRIEQNIGRRNRESVNRFELQLQAHAVSFKTDRHATAAGLLADAESRIFDADNDDEDLAAAS